jgi:hypothetical protein
MKGRRWSAAMPEPPAPVQARQARSAAATRRADLPRRNSHPTSSNKGGFSATLETGAPGLGRGLFPVRAACWEFDASLHSAGLTCLDRFMGLARRKPALHPVVARKE